MSATEPLFREDAYLQSCEATVLDVARDADGTWATLDRTVFYAEGGGQPGDAGRLAWDGGAAEIATARKGDGGAIRHRIVEGAATPAVGARVSATLDWPLRHARMRMHSALHLLSVVIPLPVTGGAIGHEKSRLDFDMPEAPGDKAEIEARLNALIEQDDPIAAEWISDAELDANPSLVKTMTVKPPRGEGRVRLIRIGLQTATVDLQPCGGTHVRTTAEIGRIALGKIEKKGKQNRRVSILFG